MNLCFLVCLFVMFENAVCKVEKMLVKIRNLLLKSLEIFQYRFAPSDLYVASGSGRIEGSSAGERFECDFKIQ